MNVNELRHRITFQKKTTTTNENGFTEESWTDIRTVFASKNNLFGREFFQAVAVQAENTVEFGIRYSGFVDEMDSKLYRITQGLKIYNITFIDNILYDKIFVKIKTLELLP